MAREWRASGARVARESGEGVVSSWGLSGGSRESGDEPKQEGEGWWRAGEGGRFVPTKPCDAL